MQHHNSEKNQLLLKNAFKDVIKEQISLGGDIITDGEIDRENYIWNFCRFHLNGFDFDHLKRVEARNGATFMIMPQITNKVTLKKEAMDLMSQQWSELQKLSSKPLKIAIPGPMTIMDSTHNEYYKNNSDALLADLAQCINTFLVHLSNKCEVKYIQIDEPIWARKCEEANRIGFKVMQKCWENIPTHIYKAIHICCGYANELDIKYQKADNHSYVKLLKYGMDRHLVDNCGVNGITIEDAHHRFD